MLGLGPTITPTLLTFRQALRPHTYRVLAPSTHFLRISFVLLATERWLSIWILAVVQMGFWTLLAWLSNQLLQLAGQWAGQLPWEQTLQNAKDLQVPAFIALWWQQMVDALAPLLRMTQGFLTGLMQFAGAVLPLVVGAVWLFGMLSISVLALVVSGGVWWFKRKQSAAA